MNLDYARRRMVEQQLRTWDVLQPSVLSAISGLARDRFVPAKFRHLAYADTEIPLGHGQSMMTPIVEGRLLQALELEPQHSVLEIGTGSGYLTACLAMLTDHVQSIDIYQDFIDQAAANLDYAKIGNVSLTQMDALDTLPDGQFDAIAVAGSIPRPLTRLVESLKPGGRMFAVVGDAPVMMAQLILRGDSAEWRPTTLFETVLAPLENVAATPAFSF